MTTEQLHRQRRRGEELEAALLEAAWAELTEAGFAKLTMESVAARARTGVAVLYRRWPNKHDLVIAAIAYFGRSNPVPAPDTGSLRGDLCALLDTVSDQRHLFTAVITASFTGLLADTWLTPAEVREKIMSDRPVYTNVIFRRADERGEIVLAAIPPAVLSMPFDLMRHDLMMTLKPITAERIREIVDEMFLPLVTAYSTAARQGQPGTRPARNRDNPGSGLTPA